MIVVGLAVIAAAVMFAVMRDHASDAPHRHALPSRPQPCHVRRIDRHDVDA